MSPARIRRALRRAGPAMRALRDREQVRRAMTPPLPSQYAEYGANNVVVPPARIERPDLIWFGSQIIVHEHAWFLVQHVSGSAVPQLRIGDGSSINRFVKIVCHANVVLGNGVILGDRVYISDVEHRPRGGDTPELTEPRPVVIGDGVLVGVGCVIKPGVTIGEHAYIGAGSIVRDDIPPGSVVVGDPARVVRRRNENGVWEPVSDG